VRTHCPKINILIVKNKSDLLNSGKSIQQMIKKNRCIVTDKVAKKIVKNFNNCCSYIENSAVTNYNIENLKNLIFKILHNEKVEENDEKNEKNEKKCLVQ
jgi:GTPase SAR1 family protein